MPDQMIILRFDADWADEFSIKGYSTIVDSQQAWDRARELIEERWTEPHDWGFGTNEEFYDLTFREWNGNIHVLPVPNTHFLEDVAIVQFLRKNEGQLSFGWGDYITYVFEKFITDEDWDYIRGITDVRP